MSDKAHTNINKMLNCYQKIDIEPRNKKFVQSASKEKTEREMQQKRNPPSASKREPN